LPAALSAKYLPGGQTQILNVHQIRRINHHPVDCDEYIAPESISDTENWLNREGDLDNPNDSEDYWVADIESDIVQDNGIEYLECPEKWDVSATPNVRRLIRPIRKSKRQAEQVLVTVNAIETRRNKGGRKK